MSDIIITWPRTRILNDYLNQLHLAEIRKELINFRVPKLPKYAMPDDRCYVVYDGWVRGFNLIRECCFIADNIVRAVPYIGTFWPAGNYITRDPKWHPIIPSHHKGFQGWRYVKKGSLLDLSYGRGR